MPLSTSDTVVNHGAPSPLNWVQSGTHHAETVVLIHAVGHDLTYWDRQIEALHTRYHVVAFDLPGHGRSPGDAADWSFDNAAAVVARLIESVSSKPVHLVGLSFGGMIAQVTTLARPELIRSLTLMGTTSRFPETARDGIRARARAVRMGGMSAVLESSLERWLTPETRLHRPDIVDRITKTVLADDPATHAAIWDVISNLNLHDRLKEIVCPTLVVVGERDASTPPAVASALAAAIAGARMVVIPDASHIVTVEAPGAVNSALLAFLDEVSNGG